MNLRYFFSLCVAVMVTASLAFSHGKDDCAAKTASAKKSCCMGGAKASLTSDTKTMGKNDATAHVISVNNPNGDEKSASHCDPNSKECNMKTAGKADCDMATMKKTGGKMDCCTMKKTEAKNTMKKSKQNKTSSDAKGTN